MDFRGGFDQSADAEQKLLEVLCGKKSPASSRSVEIRLP